MKKFQLGEFEELVLLAVGILHGSAYGVTIKDEIETRLDRRVSVGALQTTLRRLEKKGFLESSQGESTNKRGGRPKLYFALTSHGKKALESSREIRNELWDALPSVVIDM